MAEGHVSAQTPQTSPRPGEGDVFDSRELPRQTTGFLRQYELVEKVLAYQPDADEDALNAAYVYAVQQHGSQKRASGDPYYAHPVAVAGLLADLKLDQATIIAGLLHDTVEDTEVSLVDIADRFGGDVAELVDGVTKLTRLEYRSEETKQAENFQKFILATIEDVRVLLIKLADRLHNIRTLHFLKKPEKRERIARETLEIFAPLARRVGLAVYASLMEELSFAELFSDARKAIILRLDELQKTSGPDLERIRENLTDMMAAHGVECRIVGRRKSAYSIWRKLERKNQSFSEIADIFAFRVIVKNVADCYRALGIVHQTWAIIPDRFRDFISVPKPNGYRSLHTTVIAAGNRRVEIQMRTEEMHDIAERGVAAHWRYKNAAYGFDRDAAESAGLNTEFSLRTFADILEHGEDPLQYLEQAKLEMYRDVVFAFTPKGRLIMLPLGAMPLDFAYAVHSRIGDTCIGARVNGEQRSLRTVLQNGDVVEIMRGDQPAPVRGAEGLAVTHRALVAQRRLLRQKDAAAYRQLGKDLLERALRAAGFDPLEVDLPRVAQAISSDGVNAMHEALGMSRIDVDDVLDAAFPGHELQRLPATDKRPIDDDFAALAIQGEGLVPGTAVHLEECCSPVPGDRIIGIRLKGRGLSVHAIDCPRLEKYETRPDIWVDLGWTELARHNVVAKARIRVTAFNKRGVLATLCSAVAQANGNIVDLHTGERNHDYIDLTFGIEIEDLRRLNQILAALRTLTVVDRAERLREELCP
jgi:GTP diphosphokinase / guanosine-3',5'-bis(diphosphate) 3'-diphosphatase